MGDRSARIRRRVGRPDQREHDLRLLLFVELGCSVGGVSVNRFCDTHAFLGSDGRRLHRATLKRRYYQRKAGMRSVSWPWGSKAPSPAGEAWERYISEVRAVFEIRK